MREGHQARRSRIIGPGELAFRFLVLLAWVPVIVTIHELGHALMAAPAGYRLTSFGVGRGRPLLHHRGREGLVLYLGRNLLAGGACVAIPRAASPGPRAALFHAGGVLAQLGLVAVFAVLPEAWWWVEPVASFNLLVLATNVLPWRVAGMASDGWWILSRVRRRGTSGPGLIGRRSVIRRIRDFEATARSPVGTWYAELMLAWTDVLVGRLDRADAFFARAHDEAAIDPVLDVMSQSVEASWHVARGRPLAALRAIRQARAAYGPALAPDSEDLLSVAEARTWLALGEADAASRALAQVAGVGGAIGGEAAVIRLEIALHQGDADAVARAARRLAGVARGPLLDPPAAVLALGRAVDLLGGPHDEQTGQLAAVTRELAQRLLLSVDAEDREALSRRLNVGASRGEHTGTG